MGADGLEVDAEGIAPAGAHSGVYGLDGLNV